MRNLRNAIVVILIPLTVFIAVHRIGLTGGGGMFLVFLACAGMFVWAAKQDSRAGQLRLQKTAASFGFQPANRDDVALSIYPLRGGGWVNRAACGELRGLKAWIFDYTVSNPGPADMNKNISQTVIAFDVEGANLPAFQIRPLNCSTSIFDTPRWKSFDGNWEKSDQTLCFPDAVGFHQRFELVSSSEEGVRRHFDARLLNTVAALNDRNCIVKGYYNTVLFFTPDKLLQPGEMEAFARKGADIAYAIFFAEKGAMTTPR